MFSAVTGDVTNFKNNFNSQQIKTISARKTQNKTPQVFPNSRHWEGGNSTVADNLFTPPPPKVHTLPLNNNFHVITQNKLRI